MGMALELILLNVLRRVHQLKTTFYPHILCMRFGYFHVNFQRNEKLLYSRSATSSKKILTKSR
jgi:hypothetical protein